MVFDRSEHSLWDSAPFFTDRRTGKQILYNDLIFLLLGEKCADEATEVFSRDIVTDAFD